MLTPKNGAIIITGACGGIGRELCRTFFESEYRVIAIDSRPLLPNLKTHQFLQAELTDLLQNASKRDEVKLEIEDMCAGAPLKALINNAAIQVIKRFEDLNEHDWNISLNTNLVVPFFLSQMFLDSLTQSSGSIVNISSIHANQTKKFFTAYATSKAALSSMTKLLAIELGNRVRVNAIEPGAIATEMLEHGFKEYPEKRKILDEIQPMKRIGLPEEVARLARFLVSDEAEFINGATVQIDGGIRSQLYDPN